MSIGNAFNVRVKRVTDPGGWERSAECVSLSGQARFCETRVRRETDFSEFESDFLPETKVIFGWSSSQDSSMKVIIYNVIE